MRNIVIEMCYDGTLYHGFQTQKNGITVQETVEKALSKLTGEKITIYGCGRTDAGVHALKYYFNFKTQSTIPADRFVYASRPFLPDDIVFKKSFEEESEFHSRYCIVEKTYMYRILNSEHCNPFYRNYSYFYPVKLDVTKMRKASQAIVGKKDFKCFMASGGQVKSTVRTIKSLEIRENGEFIEIYITADGFLYNMVRIITGTLIYAGLGKLTYDDIEKAIEEKERTEVGVTVPPQGLFMYDIKYGKEF